MKKLTFDAKEHQLDNGLKIVTIKRNTQLMSLQLGVKVGALLENHKERGISHFIEHLVFKGTKHRNNEELNNELENLGGEYNAYTDYSSTVYSITALEDELENSIELMADMIINPSFPEEEIEKERGVILAEIRTSKDDIEDFSFNKVNEAGFKLSALRYDIIGNEKNILNLKRENIINFYNRFYLPNNSLLTIVSSLDHDKALNLAQKGFGGWKYGEIEKKDIISEKNSPVKVISFKKDIEQSTIVYLYTFHDLPKSKELALKILNHKLGESANSILFRELREKRGLAYDIYTHMDMSTYIKSFYIYTAVAEENIDSTIETIDNCIMNIKNKNIEFNNETVMLMKKIHNTAILSTLEDSTDLANYVLHQRIDDEEIFQYIKDMEQLEFIKKEDIYDVANLVLKEPTIHILRPN